MKLVTLLWMMALTSWQMMEVSSAAATGNHIEVSVQVILQFQPLTFLRHVLWLHFWIDYFTNFKTCQISLFPLD